MIAQRSRRAPVEPLPARVLRYRIARGSAPVTLRARQVFGRARFDASNPANPSTNVCWRRSPLRSECRCAGSCAENTVAFSERALRLRAWTRLNCPGGLSSQTFASYNSISAAMFARTSSSTPCSTAPRRVAVRARQSNDLMWSDSTTPVTSGLFSMTTSKA